MAAGTAIINTALSTAVPDIARDQKEALTVTPGHVAELANAMQVMATNPSLRNRLAEAGRVRVQQEYSDASYVDKTLACYRDLYRTLNPQNQ
jgi:rhamnosyl/mannosyltransferase